MGRGCGGVAVVQRSFATGFNCLLRKIFAVDTATFRVNLQHLIVNCGIAPLERRWRAAASVAPKARRHCPSQAAAPRNMIGGNRRKDIGSAIGTGRGIGRRTTGIGGTVGNGSTERCSAGLRGGQLAREHGVGHHAKTTRLG